MINLNSERLFVVGDIHGELKTLVYNLVEKLKIRDASVIVAGDFGVGFSSINYEESEYEKVRKRLEDNNLTIYAIHGNHDCFSKDTEVLTKSGFKSYDKLTLDDYVLSFNPESRTSEWKNINRIIIKKSKYLFRQSSNSIEIEVTGNHRHLVYDKKTDEFSYIETVNLYNSKNLSKKLIRGAKINNKDLNIISDDMLRLTAWILTDGYSYRISKTSNNRYFRISQSKQEYILEIRGILNNLGYKFSEYERNRSEKEIWIKGKKVKNSRNEIVFSMNSKLSKILQKVYLIDKSSTCLPSWIFDLSYRQLKIFTDTLIKANGSKMKSKGNYILYGKYEDLRKFQPLFCMCGYRCSLTKDNRGDYRLNICENYLSNALVNGKNFSIEEYNDTVFCITTELSNLLVNLKGYCYFSGNCPDWFDGKHDFERIKYLKDYEPLSWKGRIILPVGGAQSLDVKERQIENYKQEKRGSSKRVWWPDERPVKLENFDSLPGHIDIVISHEAPLGAGHTLVRESWMDFELYDHIREDREYLYKLAKEKIPERWYFGHYHNSYSGTIANTLYRGLDIHEIAEINYYDD